MKELAMVCLGGGLGSGARYLLGLGVGMALGPGLPRGTWLVNVIGCFLIEVVVAAGARAGLGELAVLTLSTGVMGGFTTYSAFNHQVLDLVRGGSLVAAAIYLSVTLLGCAVAGVGGVLVGQLLWGR